MESTNNDTLGEKSVKQQGSKLNPYAKEWEPIANKAPEVDRCLFLTFSKGYPISKTHIYEFFTRRYGQCVERVYVQNPDSDLDISSMFGKIVFNRANIVAAVMGGETRVKFNVDNKPLWCKRFQVKNIYMSHRNKYFY